MDIIKACDPPLRGINIIPQDNHLYAWVRKASTGEAFPYEGALELNAAIALSRLINPTSTGFRYFVQLSGLTPNPQIIRPIPFKGVGLDVLLGGDARDWLTEKEANATKELMAWLKPNWPVRVHRAYWNHEYAQRLFELDIRFPLIVGGFEALVNTSDRDTTWQFVNRVSQIAAWFHIALTLAELRVAYKLRSKLVHGEGFLHALAGVLPKDDQTALYQKMENLLRLTVRECLRDSSFLMRFDNATSIEHAWPVPTRPKRRSP